MSGATNKKPGSGKACWNRENGNEPLSELVIDSQLLLVWKSILFFAHCGISNMFTELWSLQGTVNSEQVLALSSLKSWI